jgi:hypothetical protein
MTLHITGLFVKIKTSYCTIQMMPEHFNKCPLTRIKTRENNFLPMN